MIIGISLCLIIVDKRVKRWKVVFFEKWSLDSVYTWYFPYLTFQNFQIFRHGDRTPSKLEIYPKAPYNPIYESLGYGQLTDVSIKHF